MADHKGLDLTSHNGQDNKIRRVQRVDRTERLPSLRSGEKTRGDDKKDDQPGIQTWAAGASSQVARLESSHAVAKSIQQVQRWLRAPSEPSQSFHTLRCKKGCPGRSSEHCVVEVGRNFGRNWSSFGGVSHLVWHSSNGELAASSTSSFKLQVGLSAAHRTRPAHLVFFGNNFLVKTAAWISSHPIIAHLPEPSASETRNDSASCMAYLRQQTRIHRKTLFDWTGKANRKGSFRIIRGVNDFPRRASGSKSVAARIRLTHLVVFGNSSSEPMTPRNSTPPRNEASSASLV
ncbi:hypothetical protein FB45DRAFT_1002489 [Roridomyces roridus]|uniref:Uncharacterized protein n=1 Tax=Roridomyces roridus TaxID=1738132 RepID=A0AAD7BZS0_9AGAR|nr:hypothetical protein FB45DRAFT_1002489 [Roridomyces roridus]